MKTTITQTAIQPAAVTVMALNKTYRGTTTGASMANMGEMHRPRHGSLALR